MPIRPWNAAVPWPLCRANSRLSRNVLENKGRDVLILRSRNCRLPPVRLPRTEPTAGVGHGGLPGVVAPDYPLVPLQGTEATRGERTAQMGSQKQKTNPLGFVTHLESDEVSGIGQNKPIILGEERQLFVVRCWRPPASCRRQSRTLNSPKERLLASS